MFIVYVKNKCYQYRLDSELVQIIKPERAAFGVARFPLSGRLLVRARGVYLGQIHPSSAQAVLRFI
jgi:hypothetical protein